MNIGIIGFGIVGKALEAYYSAESKHKVWHYDITQDAEKEHEALDSAAQVVFISVSTPYSFALDSLDCSQVEAAVDRLTGKKTIIIKSTVMPGTTDKLQAKHPEHDIFFVPEFLNEDTASEDYAHPRRAHIIGDPLYDTYDDEPYTRGIKDVIDLLPAKATYIRLQPKQAELLKLATNAFYALKVTFAQQMFDAGMTQETLDALGEDNWIYSYHLQIEHKGYRGFGGACLPKDTLALAHYSDSHLLQSAYEYNESLLVSQHRTWKGNDPHADGTCPGCSRERPGYSAFNPKKKWVSSSGYAEYGGISNSDAAAGKFFTPKQETIS